jgi:hypothetical protein
MIKGHVNRTLKSSALVCALLAGGCSKDLLSVKGLELSLADMQARYPCVAHPPPTWHLRSEELRGEQFELFDGDLIVGVFHVPASAATDGEQTVVHFVVPHARLKTKLSIDGESVETNTFEPTVAADSSDYFYRSLHGSTISVELLELNAAVCHREAKFRIR